MILIAAGLAGIGIVVLLRGPQSVHLARVVAARPVEVSSETPESRSEPGSRAVVTRWRSVLAILAAAAGITVLGGIVGWVVGAGLAAATWIAAGRVEAPARRRAREEARRSLPHVVVLISSCLGSGASVREALRQVAAALPGPATAPLMLAAERLDVGMPAGVVWELMGRDESLAPLSRALARSDDTGAPVSTVLAVLGDELARDERARVEDQARQVGVRAAVPLGVCLLPAFLLLGIVPVVVATLGALSW